MFPENIAELYELVPVSTKVNLIDQPSKIGWLRGTMYIERHALLEGGNDPGSGEYGLLQASIAAVADGRPVEVDWQAVSHAFTLQNGVPAPVSYPKEKRRGVTAASSVDR
jgi:L,D-transpeptidase ErfK/SrfK